MQLIDLSDVQDFSAARFLLYWLVASVVAIIVAYSIGQENKLKWFIIYLVSLLTKNAAHEWSLFL